jgi:WXG100 family type VII secretion target
MADLKQVVFESMHQAENDMATAYADCMRTDRNVESTVATLSSTWRGPAANAMQGAMNTWHADFIRVLQSLDELYTTFKGVTGAYADTEETIQSSFQQYGSGLGG